MQFSTRKVTLETLTYYAIRLDFKKGKRIEISIGRGKDKWKSKLFTKDIFNKVTMYGMYLNRYSLTMMTGYPILNGKVVAPQ